MAVQPLSPATDRRFGGPLPRQLPNRTRAHLCAINLWHGHHAMSVLHAVLASVSGRYSPHTGRLLTRYSPVRHYASVKQASPRTVRLECVMHAASVYPEPGSNSLNMVYIPDIVRYTSELIPLLFSVQSILKFQKNFQSLGMLSHTLCCCCSIFKELAAASGQLDYSITFSSSCQPPFLSFFRFL